MKRRRVGGSGLSVGRLGLGTMTWGSDVDVETARGLLRVLVDAGGDLVDTAPAYGGGRAEELIGRHMRSDLRRDDLVIATKAGFGVRGLPRNGWFPIQRPALPPVDRAGGSAPRCRREGACG